MPTYGYRCSSCQEEFELWQKMSDEPVASCPSCGGAGTRLFYPAGIVFKGSGFYKTDSRSASGSGSGSSTGSSGAASESSPGTKGEKPEGGQSEKAGAEATRTAGAGTPDSMGSSTGMPAATQSAAASSNKTTKTGP